ncbi:MAG TPA: glycosyltransferase [Patescibacteria group bacterium]|nr:glycosyltransferase [Patescibacteria group bacterium]
MKVINWGQCLLRSIRQRFRKKYCPGLQPVAGLKPLNTADNWDRTTVDPQFLFSDPLPEGWVLISWWAASGRNVPVSLRLYVDAGAGFTEERVSVLGVVKGDRREFYQRVINIPAGSRSWRLDPGEDTGPIYLADFTVVAICAVESLGRAVKSLLDQRPSIRLLEIWRIWRRNGTAGLLERCRQSELPAILASGWNECYNQAYTVLVAQRMQGLLDRKPPPRCCYRQKRPGFTLLLLLDTVAAGALESFLDALKLQTYVNWELYIVLDSPTSETKAMLDWQIGNDGRIRLLDGAVSEADGLNRALKQACGRYAAVLQTRYHLLPNALEEMNNYLETHPDVDMLYSDEDWTDFAGRRYLPHFKPDWAPDTFLLQNFIGLTGVYRTELLRKLGGFRSSSAELAAYDAVLRVAEKTDKIHHISQVLFTCCGPQKNKTINDLASDASANGCYLQVLREALQRRGEGGRLIFSKQQWHILYPVDPQPLISILIPTRDQSALLSSCLRSLFALTTYKNFEVIIIDNGSAEEQTRRLLTRWRRRQPARLRVIRDELPFNYSRLNNLGFQNSRGDLLLLLNNDVEIVTPDWLERMAGQALRAEIGAVGAKLLYPDRTVQHAGIIMGVGGIAVHGHRRLPEESAGYFGQLGITTNCAAVTGACLMVKRELFALLGGLDDQLAVAYNDIDFCLCLMRQGKRNLVEKSVTLIHHESVSRGQDLSAAKAARLSAEAAIIQARWPEILQHDPYYNPNLTRRREDYSLDIS